jgi:hypothetical protein
MFKSKTVFVIGAGASAEIGLPIGSQLRDTIAKKLNVKYQHGYERVSGDRTIADAYRILATRDGADPNLYRSAGVEASEALPLAISIDNYLEAHESNKHVEACGKMAIAISILEAERTSALYFDPNKSDAPDLAKTMIQQSWFVALNRFLTEGVSKTGLDKLFANVTFIVFNYDRCLETFLFYSLQRYYGISASRSAELLGMATFLHPYGTVGDLPWQRTSKSIRFGQEIDANGLIEIAGGIRTFSERVEAGDFLSLVRENISKAEAMIFLGFSYLSQNMAMLSVDTPSQVKRVYGTAFNISESDCVVVSKDIRRAIQRSRGDVSVELRNATCASLFSEYSRSLTQ